MKFFLNFLFCQIIGFLQKSDIKSLLWRINNDKNCHLRRVRFFDIIFRLPGRIDAKFPGDFCEDFCRMSNKYPAKVEQLRNIMGKHF